MHFRECDVFVTLMGRSYDYEPESGILTLRMPSPVHDFFKTSFANEIRDQLKRIADKGGATGEFAAKIEDGGSSRICWRRESQTGHLKAHHNQCGANQMGNSNTRTRPIPG